MRRVKLPVTSEALRDMRAAWSMNADELAAIFGIDRKTVSRWEHGATPIPKGTQILLLLMDASPTFYRAVVRLAGGHSIESED